MNFLEKQKQRRLTRKYEERQKKIYNRNVYMKHNRHKWDNGVLLNFFTGERIEFQPPPRPQQPTKQKIVVMGIDQLLELLKKNEDQE
jgi:hypothetical protein